MTGKEVWWEGKDGGWTNIMIEVGTYVGMEEMAKGSGLSECIRLSKPYIRPCCRACVCVCIRVSVCFNTIECTFHIKYVVRENQCSFPRFQKGPRLEPTHPAMETEDMHPCRRATTDRF